MAPRAEGWVIARPSAFPNDVGTLAPSSAAAVFALTPARAAADVAAVLDVSREQAQQIVAAFQEFVARPIEAQLKKLKGRHLALRNPMIYIARSVSDTGEWISSVLKDKQTSAIECLLGTWQEEVARIVSGGIKPPTGVDLVVEDGRDVCLYAIQSAPNTKNAAGSKHDLDALKSAAAVLRNQRRHVACFVAVLFGRPSTMPHRREPGVVVLGSDDFWARISGVADFRVRLVRATLILSRLIDEQSEAELERIRHEAVALFDDGTGKLKIDALADPPRRQPKLQNGIQLELPSS